MDQTRYVHSVAVACLADSILERLGRPEYERRHAAAAGLLHDASQWALSHSCEGAFARLTGSNNGAIIHAMVFDEPSLPSRYHVGEMLEDLGLDRSKLWDLLMHDTVLASDLTWRAAGEMFANPFHPDTLDGITRACQIFGVSCPSSQALADAFTWHRGHLCIFRSSLELLDEFWNAKTTLYSTSIHNAAALRRELQFSLAVYDSFQGVSLDAALDLGDEDVLRVVSDKVHRMTAEETAFAVTLRFRRPRRYFIESTAKLAGPLIPTYKLGDRYKSLECHDLAYRL